MNSRRSWRSMETDCLVEIFAKLSLGDLTLTVPFVCKSWLAAARHPLCWRKLNFREINLLPWSKFSKNFALHYSLPHLSFTKFFRFTVNLSCNSVTEIKFPLQFTSLQDLTLASNECRNLKYVSLPILSQSVEIQLPQLVWKWKNLKKLEFESKPSNFSELVKNISLNCRRFSWLGISRSSIKEDDALAMVSYLPKLKRLELINSYVAKEHLVIILNGCKEMESLSVIDCIGFDGDEEEINSIVSQIKDFKLVGCKAYYEHDCESEFSSTSLWCSGYSI